MTKDGAACKQNTCDDNYFFVFSILTSKSQADTIPDTLLYEEFIMNRVPIADIQVLTLILRREMAGLFKHCIVWTSVCFMFMF